VLVGPGGQYRRAFKQQKRHGHVVRQQGETLDAWAGLRQQRVQSTVDVAGKFDLLRVDFNRRDLLTLQRAEAVVRQELG